MNQADFLPLSDHFARLVTLLEPPDFRDYNRLKHTRQETGYRGRTFYVYEIRDRVPNILDHITVQDFSCTDDSGASTELRNSHGETLIVGYAPIRLFDYPIFVSVALHNKVRWSTTDDNIMGGSLAFDLVIRTASRLHLRERGVTYCETGVSYAKEFGTFVDA